MENVDGEATDHVVDIPGLLAQMVDRISESLPSTLPRERRTADKPCIFPVRDILNYNDIPYKWCMPQVVALGPCYQQAVYDDHKIYMMEEIKWRWFASFTESRKEELEECLIQLGPLVKEVRECYSDSISPYGDLDTDELLQRIVVDGFFILALFFRVKLNLTELDPDERSIFDNPLYSLDMVILPKIYGDLLLLQNQIPSFVLEKLYTICFNISSRKSLFVIATNFLYSISAIPETKNMSIDQLRWLHLLDLVRLVFISRAYDRAVISRAHYKKMQIAYDYRPFSLIPNVTKLCRAGIKVKRHTANTFLDVKFKNGVIQMPDIILDDPMCSLLVNCVAFEQMCNVSKHFSIYATLLDCLVNTAKDIDYLCDHGVIANVLGTDDEAAKFINALGRGRGWGLTIYNDGDDDDYFFLLDVFGGVNKYYRKGLNWGKWMSFKNEYFGKPWLLISALVGFVLLVLTFLQTYYTIYAYEHPKNDVNCIGEPSKMYPAETIDIHASFSVKFPLPKSASNWLQCREVLYDDSRECVKGTICGKWRRAPFAEVQTDAWDCSCAVLWDPAHADRAVPQELETEQVLQNLNQIEKLKSRLASRKRTMPLNKFYFV